MAKKHSYTASVVIRLEIGAQLTFRANDEDEAAEIAQKIADATLISWQAKPGTWPGVDIEFEETDQSAEIDTIDED